MPTGFRTVFKLFGRFLIERGVITQEDVFFARALQRRKNRKIGEHAVVYGYMTQDEVEFVLIKQEDRPGVYFGKIAIEEGIITKDQLERLLKHQTDSHLFLGMALVERGVITKDKLISELKAYNLEKLRYLKLGNSGDE